MKKRTATLILLAIAAFVCGFVVALPGAQTVLAFIAGSTVGCCAYSLNLNEKN